MKSLGSTPLLVDELVDVEEDELEALEDAD
jgi:hypothetical protein